MSRAVTLAVLAAIYGQLWGLLVWAVSALMGIDTPYRLCARYGALWGAGMFLAEWFRMEAGRDS